MVCVNALFPLNHNVRYDIVNVHRRVLTWLKKAKGRVNSVGRLWSLKCFGKDIARHSAVYWHGQSERWRKLMKKSLREIREASSTLATNRITDGGSSWGLKSYGSDGKFRSKYEHAFAVYLKELGIKYQFEKYGEEIMNISDTKLHYIPDFYLPDYRLYVEIVNIMDKRLEKKMFYFREQNKNARLIVLDKQHLREMFDSKFTIYDVIGQPKKRRKM